MWFIDHWIADGMIEYFKKMYYEKLWQHSPR